MLKVGVILMVVSIALPSMPPAQARSTVLATYVAHDFIRISGNLDLVVGQNGVVSGDGSSGNPYVISGWLLGPSNGSAGIQIWDTTVHIKIVNVNVTGCNIGVSLNNDTNIAIRNSVFNNNIVGVSVMYSDGISVSGNTFRANYYAVSVTYATVSISGNTYVDNTKNLIAKSLPWEQTWVGQAVCLVIMVPLIAILGMLVYYRVTHRRRPPMPPP